MTQQFLQVAKVVGNGGQPDSPPVFWDEQLFVIGAKREVIDKVKEEYYKGLWDTPFVRLRRALAEATAEFRLESTMEVVAGAVVGKILYLAINGSGKVLLSREGETDFILQGRDGQIVTTSGFLKDRDIFLLGLKDFFNFFKLSDLREALISSFPQEAAALLSSKMPFQADKSFSSALIVQFNEREERKIEIIPLKEERLKRLDPKEKTKRMTRTVVGVLLFLLLISTLLGVFHKGQKKPNLVKQDQVVTEEKREHEVAANVFYDLVLIKDKASLQDAVLVDEALIVLDQGQESVYKVQLADKSSAIVTGGKELRTASQIAVDGGSLYLLTGEGILRQKDNEKKPQLVVKANEGWSDFTDLAAFGGNLYLGSKKGAIWQYKPEGEGFDNGQSWLRENLNLGSAFSLIVDGSVWFLNSQDTLFKLQQGGKASFSPAIPLSGVTSLYTSPDLVKIYLLEAQNKKVVVLEKTGEYSAQYHWNEEVKVKGLVVSENL